MNDANGSGGSAVVIASRDAKDVMRMLEIHEPWTISHKHCRRAVFGGSVVQCASHSEKDIMGEVLSVWW